MRPDHRVHRSDRRAPAFQLGPQVAYSTSAALNEGKISWHNHDQLQGCPYPF
jgi:hypothetical protein